MPVLASLMTCCLKPLVEGASAALGYSVPALGTDAVGGFLSQRFTDHSQKLTLALTRANQQAWQTLELALAGDSAWDQCQALLASADRQSFRAAVRALLAQAPDSSPAYRRSCWEELRHARSVGLLDATTQPQELLAAADPLLRFSSPTELLAIETRILANVAQRLDDAGCCQLARLIVVQEPGQPPIVVAAVRYFFRRAVEQDSALAQGLAFAQLERLQVTQEQGFAAVEQLIRTQIDAVRDVLTNVQSTLLDLRSEQQRQGATQRALYDEVQRVGERLERILERPMRRTDSLSIRSEGERALVRQVVNQYRALPSSQQTQLPALLNAIGRLELAVGECAAAQTDFQTVARIVTDEPTRALAHYQAYLAALEQRNYPTAFTELVEAVRWDARKYAPFPVERYTPEKILGAGGFGVAFLCKHKQLGTPVVIKALFADDLDRDLDDVFREARTLDELEHPNIVRLRDCDYTLAGTRERPYFVLAHFDGVTLDAHVRQQGVLSVNAAMEMGRQMAAGLQAAHERGILHRDVKPANVLVRPPVAPAADWRVKLIDFGLALRRSVLQDASQNTDQPAPTATHTSIAGTLDYSAPEQLGRLLGEKVRPPADVYGWAKTMCYALFQTPTPRRQHWAKVPEALADLLDRCLAEKPSDRPQSFAEVRSALDQMTTGVSTPANPAIPVLAIASPTIGDQVLRLELLQAELRTLQKLLERPVELRKARPVSVVIPLFIGVAIAVPTNIVMVGKQAIHPLMVIPIVLGIAAVVGAIIYLWNWWFVAELRSAQASIDNRIQALIANYPTETRQWGGAVALSSPDVVTRLIEQEEDEIARLKGLTPPSKSWWKRIKSVFQS